MLRKFDPSAGLAPPPGGKVLGDGQYTRSGRAVLFMSASDGTDGYDYDVYEMDLKTGVLEQLTTRNGYSTGLRVSPDGDLAVFLKWSKNSQSTPIRPRLYVLGLKTKELRELNISFNGRAY